MKTDAATSVLRRLRHIMRHPYSLLTYAPVGIINDARAWTDYWRGTQPADIRRGPAACYWEMDAPSVRALSAPRSLSGGEKKEIVNRLVPIERTALFLIKRARILGAEGVVISPDNRVFAEFTYVDEQGGIDKHSIFRLRRFNAPRFLRGWYATLCYPSSFAYFHWIAESLPRLKLLHDYVDALDGIFIPSDMEPAMEESLLCLGLKKEQLIPLEMKSHYLPEHLLIPQYCAGLNIPAWASAFLRERVLEKTAYKAKRRIYISRADTGKRRIVNEDIVWPVLADRGFERVCLRELGFRSQAQLFDSAEIVVGPHGAGLANVVFCRPGAKLLELLPSAEVAPHVYYSMITAAGGEYWCMRGEPQPGTEDIPGVHRDFTIDPRVLQSVVDAMLEGE